MRSVFLSVFMVFMFITSSHALVCERTYLDNSGFTFSSKGAASWFPQKIRINDSNFQKIEGQKSVVYSMNRRSKNGPIYTVTYRLLPDKRLLASLSQKAGYKPTGTTAYKCDKSSLDVALFNDESFYQNAVPQKTAQKQSMDFGAKDIIGKISWDNVYADYDVNLAIKKNELSISRMNGDQLCSGHFFRSNRDYARAKFICPKTGSMTLLMIFEGGGTHMRAVGFDNRKRKIHLNGKKQKN